MIGRLGSIGRIGSFTAGRGGQSTTVFDPSTLEYQALWTANGKTNSDADKNVPNLVDATNPLVCSNFAWALNSGYGLYTQNYNQWGYGNLNVITYTHTDSKIELKVPHPANGNFYSHAGLPITTGYIFDFKIKVTGLNNKCTITVKKGSYSEDILTITQNGIYEIKATVQESWDQKRIYFFIANLTSGSDNNITIEQIPEGEGLYLDGIDDKFTSSKFLPDLDKYTIVADIDYKLFANNGISKPSNWGIYGDRVYINTFSKYTLANDVIAINSNGLIVTKSNSMIGLVGTNTPFPTSVNSANNPFMVFRSLAIIPQELNEQEIRQVYDYLKTLKANNIG